MGEGHSTGALCGKFRGCWGAVRGARGAGAWGGGGGRRVGLPPAVPVRRILMLEPFLRVPGFDISRQRSGSRGSSAAAPRPGPAPPPPPQGYGSGLGAGVRAGTQTPRPRRPDGGRMVEPGDRRWTRRPRPSPAPSRAQSRAAASASSAVAATTTSSEPDARRPRRFRRRRLPEPRALPPPCRPGPARARAVLPRACVRARAPGHVGAGRVAGLRCRPSFGRAGSGTCGPGFPLPPAACPAQEIPAWERSKPRRPAEGEARVRGPIWARESSPSVFSIFSKGTGLQMRTELTFQVSLEPLGPR